MLVNEYPERTSIGWCSITQLPLPLPSLALRISITLLIISLVTFFSTSALCGGKWKGKEVDKEGVVHIMNPSEPIENGNTVELKELWRIGGDTDDEDEFFGLISRITTDDKGNVYLLDTQLSEIKVFSPQGEYIKTLGREGEGPGEFRIPTGMFFTPEGNLGVLQVAPGKIVLLTSEGEPAGEHPLPQTEDGGFLILRNGQYKNGNLVLSVSKNAFSEGRFDQKQYLCSIDKEGKERARYHEETLTIDFANPVMDDAAWNNFNNRWTIGSDGRVYSAPEYGSYSIHIWQPDGQLDRIIEREYQQQKRTQDELDLVNDIMQVFVRQIPNGKIKISDYNSNVEQLHARADGSLWVVASYGSRDNPDGSLAIFDVFDSEGHYVRKVTLMGEGNPQTDGYYFVGNRLYVVTDLLQASLTLQAGGQPFQIGDEEPEPMQVICYELDEDLWLSKK